MPRPTDAVAGSVASGFEVVERTFGDVLRTEGEQGAAFAVVRDGRPLVDLWGGVADPHTGRPWARDTTQVIFSGTKALVATCLLVLVERGELDPEAPVASYWPEFGEQGKGEVKVVDCLSHQARLPGIAVPVGEEELVDDRRMAALLAAQARETDPRAADAYHALTYGWLCGELVRRIDGRSIGCFFAEEVAGPLGLDLWIGLPPDRQESVARIVYAPGWGERLQWDAEQLAADELLGRVWNNPPLFPADRLPWNRPDWQRAEIPGAGAIGSARAVAKLLCCLSRGGEIDGWRLLSEQTVTFGRTELNRRFEPLVQEPMAFGFGLQLQTEERRFGPPADAFGHGGAGGSVHCAWPTERVGISFAMNTMRDEEPVDRRAEALLKATHEALVRTAGKSAARV